MPILLIDNYVRILLSNDDTTLHRIIRTIPNSLHKMTFREFAYHVVSSFCHSALGVTAVNDMRSLEYKPSIDIIGLTVFKITLESGIAKIL